MTVRITVKNEEQNSNAGSPQKTVLVEVVQGADTIGQKEILQPGQSGSYFVYQHQMVRVTEK